MGARDDEKTFHFGQSTGGRMFHVPSSRSFATLCCCEDQSPGPMDASCVTHLSVSHRQAC